MLSRVADSLFWMARYIERAEDVTRILAVNFSALLDAPIEDDELGWRPILATSGDEGLFLECMAGEAHPFSARNVIDFMLWHPGNPNAVLTCITRARENARSVREQISSEMWEQINKLYFLGLDIDRDAIRRGPHEFFTQVRDGSHAFQGITHATMIHGEGYEFIQLGKYLERASTTLRILDAKYTAVNQLPEGSPESALQLISMLKSCSAFEAFRKSNAGSLQAWRVLEYLLMSSDFPRSVRYCLARAQEAADGVAAMTGKAGAAPNPTQRMLGRMTADLNYLDIRDVLAGSVHAMLTEMLARILQTGDAIARAYFSTQVIVASPRTARAALEAQQHQQQQ